MTHMPKHIVTHDGVLLSADDKLILFGLPLIYLSLNSFAPLLNKLLLMDASPAAACCL